MVLLILLKGYIIHKLLSDNTASIQVQQREFYIFKKTNLALAILSKLQLHTTMYVSKGGKIYCCGDVLVISVQLSQQTKSTWTWQLDTICWLYNNIQPSKQHSCTHNDYVGLLSTCLSSHSDNQTTMSGIICVKCVCVNTHTHTHIYAGHSFWRQ